MMSKKIMGSMRIFQDKKSGNYGMEISKNMDDADILVFAGMIIEVLADKHNVSQEVMAESLIKGNKSWPMTFDNPEDESPNAFGQEEEE